MSGVKLCADCGKGITGRRKYYPECVKAHQDEYAKKYRECRAWSVKTNSNRIEVRQPGVMLPDYYTQADVERYYFDFPAGTLIDGQPIGDPAQAGESEK